MKRMIAEEWQKLSEERRRALRASRSKMGIRCDICGILGYYRENCPNECVSPPSTPGSLDSTPPGTPPGEPIRGLGVLWTDFTDTEENDDSVAKDDPRKRRENKISLTNVKVDMNTVRPAATNAMEKLRETDKPLGGFEFFTKAEEGYSRSFAELTLHQVMRRIMRLLERQISSNKEKLEASFDVTLLHPPAEKDSEKFYSDELFKIKEYRDYFVKKEMKKDRKPIHRHQAGVRPPDQLDVIFRGAMSESTDDFLFKVDPKAGQSIHGKNTWKSILANNDDLAISDPTMAAKQAALDKQFHQQSKWITMQKRNMEHTNDRFEHVVYILRDQIGHEHSRETKYLLASKHERKSTQMEVYLERLNSVDIMMMCIKSYKFTAGLEEADFLVSCLEKWKQQSQPHKPVAKQVIKIDNSATATAVGAASSAKNGKSSDKYKVDSDRALIDAAAQGDSSLTGKGGEERDNSSIVTRDSDDDTDDDKDGAEEPPPQQVIAEAEAKKQAENKGRDKSKKATDTSYSNRMLAASASPYEQDLDIIEEKKVQAEKDSRKRAIVAAEMKLAMDVERAEVAKSTQAGKEAEAKKKANQKKKWDETRKKEVENYRRQKGTLTESDLIDTDTSTVDANQLPPSSTSTLLRQNSSSISNSDGGANVMLGSPDSSLTDGGQPMRKQSSAIANALTSKRVVRDKRSQLLHSKHNKQHVASAPVLLAHPSHYHHDTHALNVQHQHQLHHEHGHEHGHEHHAHHHHYHHGKNHELHVTPGGHVDHSPYHRDYSDGTAHDDPIHLKHSHNSDPHGHKVYIHEGAFVDAHYNETKNVVSRTMTHMAELQKEMEDLDGFRDKEHKFAHSGEDDKIPSTGTMMLQALVEAIVPHAHSQGKELVGVKDGDSVGSGGSSGSMAALIAAARASVAAEQASQEEAAKTDPMQWKKALVAAKEHADGLKAAAELKEKRRQAMRTSAPVKQFQVKARLTQRQVDEAMQEKAKQSFKRAGIGGHIRKGTDEDLAYLAPTLIPVPGAFQSDGSNPLISHTAENTLFEIKKSMILGVSGYTPQQMLPLFQRNTLMELNGVSSGGDQNYLVMAGDRRYSHYVGRALNRFDPDAADDVTYDIEALARGHTSTMFLDSQKAAAEGKTSSLSNAAGKTLPTLNIQNLTAVVTTGESLYGNEESIKSITDFSSQEYGKGKGLSSTKSGVSGSGSLRGGGRSGSGGLDDNSTLVTSSTARIATEGGGGEGGVAIVAPSRKVQFDTSQEGGKSSKDGGSLACRSTSTGTGTGSKARNRLDKHITRNKAQALAEEKEAAAKERRRHMRQLAREKEAGKGKEMSTSLVRMAFGSTLPTLADLAYMEEHDDDDMF